jgi:hypothetical protein
MGEADIDSRKPIATTSVPEAGVVNWCTALITQVKSVLYSYCRKWMCLTLEKRWVLSCGDPVLNFPGGGGVWGREY